MPWLETDVRDQRIQFVLAMTRPAVTMTAGPRGESVTAPAERASHSAPRRTEGSLRKRARNSRGSELEELETVNAFGWRR